MVLITEIEDRKIVKPYLGGWRNKITGDKYLNAASQTGPPPKNISWHDCCSIGVQTVETKDETTQSSRNKITQMWRKRYEQELLRKINPRSRTDFDMLYELIERWRRDRTNEINERYFKATQRAENCFLLEKTVKMFNVLDKFKQSIREEYQTRKRVKFLRINSKSIQWHGYKSKLIEMVTLKNQKAREYLSIYNSLSDYLKFVATSATCSCTNISKGFKKDPQCEEFREPLEIEMIFCRGCRRILPYNRFSPHSGLKKLTTCTSCTTLRERSYCHVNYDPYIFILNHLRAEEKRRRCFSALAFMMQPRDVYHLINNIWHGHSVISKQEDIHLLRLARYNNHIEWSPWNCILLTEEEVEIHYRINDLTKVYSKALLHQILLKHLTAKNYFKRLSYFDRKFRESSRFYVIQDRKDYVPFNKGIDLEGYEF
ncbi:hypothetical protein M0804_005197 [Polistes exclamans]|nr:hypothetical protein M0804_005197 [Polistes exclamans]